MRQTAIYIDKRIDHIIDFDRANVKRTYVVCANRVDVQELIRFYTTDETRSKVIFQTNSPEPKCVNAAIISQETKKVGENEFEINATLRLEPEENAPVDSANGKPSVKQGEPFLILNSEDEDRKQLTLSLDLNRANIDNTTVRINLKFTTPDERAQHTDYESELELYFAPAPEIYDVVIDFGSEASQIIASARNEEVTRSHRKDVFEDMCDVVNKSCSNQNFDQKDASDNTLYKSVFYVKSAIDNLEKAMADCPVAPIYQNPAYRDSNDTVLSILTSKEESNGMLAFNENINRSNYIRLPNIKLAQFGGVALPKIKVKRGPRSQSTSVNDFNDNYFYRASLNHFILSTLKGLDENVKAVSVHILMPNVYDHFAVTKNLDYIRHDIAEIIKNNPTCKFDGEEYDLLRHIQAVEVDMMFESDASFIGLMTKLNSEINEHSLRDGNYLILDAGKGTLDYSVVNLVGREFLNICHGGIIGAGNALTSAYIFALFHDYVTFTTRAEDLNIEDLIELLYTKVLGATDLFDDLKWNKNLAKINEMVTAVERYKAACNGNYELTEPKRTATASNRGLDDLSLEEFITHVNSKIDRRTLQSLSDKAQSYVDNVIEKICKDVADNIELTCGKVFARINNMEGGNDNIGIDQAIFVGRGFLHKPLKRKIIEALSEKNMCKEISERTIDEAMFSTSHDNMMKEVCLYVSRMLNNGKYSNINTLITTDSDSFDTIEEAPETENTKKERRDILTRISSWFNPGRGVSGGSKKAITTTTRFIAPLLQTFISPGAHASISQPIEQLRTSQMAEGYIIYKHEGDSHIIIGGNKYEFPNQTPNGRHRLFFAADDTIYLRSDSDGTINTLERRAVNLGNSSFAIPTLFPYINNINYPNDFRSVFLNILKPSEKPEPVPEEKPEQPSTEEMGDKATEEKKTTDAKNSDKKESEEKKDKDKKKRTIGGNISEL